MNAQLLIHIDADDAMAWQRPDSGARGDGAPPTAVRAGADRVVVLVPGEAVLLTRARLPPGSPGKLAQVLPYALEDRLLDDVQQLHFVAGPRDPDGQHAVAVVARERMQAWLNALADAGIDADVLLPDTLAVPLPDGQACALLLGDRCLVRTAADAGFVCRFDELSDWVAADQPLCLRLPPGQAMPEPPADRDWSLQRGEPTLAVADDVELNLLAGDFASQHRRAPRRRLWRIAAVLAAVAIGIGLVTQITAIVRLNAATAQARETLEQRYAELFPESPPVANPVARVRSELKQLGAGSETSPRSLIGMLSQAAPILASHQYSLEMLGLQYRNHSLELSLRVPELSRLDGLREQLATLPGIDVRLEAATPGEHGIDGRISLTAVGT